MTTWSPAIDETREPSRARARVERARVARPAPVRVRSWTGRAAMSVATDSGLPHLVTAGTYRTRVSEMRIAAAREHRAASATATQRRYDGLPRRRYGRPRGSG